MTARNCKLQKPMERVVMDSLYEKKTGLAQQRAAELKEQQLVERAREEHRIR